MKYNDLWRLLFWSSINCFRILLCDWLFYSFFRGLCGRYYYDKCRVFLLSSDQNFVIRDEYSVYYIGYVFEQRVSAEREVVNNLLDWFGNSGQYTKWEQWLDWIYSFSDRLSLNYYLRMEICGVLYWYLRFFLWLIILGN